jgi:putative peptidoglycan lipid II flippase
MIASFLGEGAISYLYYADRLNQLPLGVVGIAVGTALLPMLSRAMAKAEREGHDNGEACDLFNRALEYCLLLALPAAAALAVIPLTLITVLFERGAFTAADSAVTANILACYSIGLSSLHSDKGLLDRPLGAPRHQDPRKISIIGMSLNILIALCMAPIIGVVGIAFATGITGWVQYIHHIRVLKDHTRRRNSTSAFSATCRKSLGRLVRWRWPCIYSPCFCRAGFSAQRRFGK